MKLTIVIPAYNEEKTIGKVIKEIPNTIPSIDKIDVIVIDDGSTDKTAEVARNVGAKVYSFKHNKGLAKAVAEGFARFLESDSDILVLTDADDQYDSREIPLLVDPIIQKKADMVLGDRQVKKLDHMKFGNKIGNMMVTKMLSTLIGMDVLDAQSAFRSYTRETVARLHIFSNYTFTQETLIELKYKKLRIINVPVSFRQRTDKSRLISNIFSYAYKTVTIVAATLVFYKSFKFFGILSGILFGIGTAFSIFVLNHFYNTGSVAPYYPSAMLAVLFLIVASVSALMAIVSSIMGRQSLLLEELLYLVRTNQPTSKSKDVIPKKIR
ncbi:MAG: glycosyltransferase family 2 protein [Nitrosopumilaceae archaeon]